MEPGLIEQALSGLGIWSVFLLSFLGPYVFPAAGELAILVSVALDHRALAAVAALGLLGAMASDHLAYGIGRLAGTRFLERTLTDEKRRQLELRIAHHAARALIAGRMLTGARTWLAILAGAGSFSWRRFTLYNAAGCALWSLSFTGAGLLLGATVDMRAVVAQVNRSFWSVAGAVLVLFVARALWTRRQRSRTTSGGAAR